MRSVGNVENEIKLIKCTFITLHVVNYNKPQGLFNYDVDIPFIIVYVLYMYSMSMMGWKELNIRVYADQLLLHVKGVNKKDEKRYTQSNQNDMLGFALHKHLKFFVIFEYQPILNSGCLCSTDCNV